MNKANPIDDTAFQVELANPIKAGNLSALSNHALGNAHTYDAIFFPMGPVVTENDATACVQFCTLSRYDRFSECRRQNFAIYYGIHPDMEVGTGCFGGCGSAANNFGN